MKRETPPETGGGRLAAVASMVPRSARVAEIGTDHALLPLRLLESGQASHCIASDLSGSALAVLRESPEMRPYRARLELRIGDGLGVLRVADAVDVLVLAGLGAHKILRILEPARLGELGILRLVLQPQTDPPLLRRWLNDNGWRIVAERIVGDRHRFYVVMAAEPARGKEIARHPTLGEDDLMEVGPFLARSTDPRIRRYWTERLATFEAARARARDPDARGRALRNAAVAKRILGALPPPGSTGVE